MDKILEENLVKIAENAPKVYESGYKVGFEEGKKAEYDAFWDAIQNKGNPTNYNYVFSYGRFRLGGIDMYNPKYDIKIYDNVTTAGYNIYSFSGLTDTKVAIYANSYGINNAFSNCTKLKRIPKLVLKRTTTVNSAFYKCEALEELYIEGIIGQNGLDLHWSTKLNKASIESVINALSDETDGLTVTLSETAVANAFTDEEWSALEATKTNWTIVLKDE